MYLFLIVFILASIHLSTGRDDKNPMIEDLFTSSKLIEGEKFSIICQVKYGPVHFDWLLNGQSISNSENILINQLDESSILNVKKMSLDYAGEYTCKIKGSLNQDSRTISVKLNGKLDDDKLNFLFISCVYCSSQAAMDQRTNEHLN